MPREETIKVAVAGATGKMGRMVCTELGKLPGIEVVLATDRAHEGASLQELFGPECPNIVIESKLGSGIDRTGAKVLIDFTHPGCAADHALTAMRHGAAAIVGTSNITPHDCSDIDSHARTLGVPAMVVPNFAVGAVLMMKFAELAARWLPDVEVVEMHHDKKIDAPSGTAKATVDKIALARGQRKHRRDELISVEGVRGGLYRDVHVHSLRIKGLLAHQEVLFGGPGQILTIRHDAMDRTSYMPGIEIAVRKVWTTQGLTMGLDGLLFSDLGLEPDHALVKEEDTLTV